MAGWCLVGDRPQPHRHAGQREVTPEPVHQRAGETAGQPRLHGAHPQWLENIISQGFQKQLCHIEFSAKYKTQIYYLCTKYVFNLKVSCQFRSKKSKICSIKTIHQCPIQGVLFIGGAEEEGDNSGKKWSLRPGFPGDSDNTDNVALRGRPVAQCRGPGVLIKLQSDPRPPDLDGRVREIVSLSSRSEPTILEILPIMNDDI